MSTRLNEPKGFYKMRFIGKPNGKLMKNAPGNFIHGQIYQQPYHMCEFPYWELVEETPTLVAPPPDDSDSVFEEAVFIPDEPETDEAMVKIAPTPEKIIGDANIDPDAPASIKPYMHYSPATNKLSEYVEPEITTTEPIGEVTISTMEPEPTRNELKKKLDDAGVEYDKRTRTSILKTMVEELESQE